LDMHEVTLITQLPTTAHQLAIPYIDTDSIAKHGLTIPDLHLGLFKAETKVGSVARIPHGQSVAILIGGEQTTRDFVANAVRSASNAAPLVIDLRGKSDEVLAAAEAAMLAIKTPTNYKSETKSEKVSVQLLVDNEVSLSPAEIVAREVIRAREIINMPANDLYPQVVADKAKSFAEGLPLNIEVWDEQRLEKENCGGILGVGRGSVRPPRLVKIEYKGGGKHIGLAGKGITFDTGGLSLKPADGMVGMKYDMAGAATVLAATLAIARLGLKVDVTTVLCLAENMPSGSATRPGDVLKIRNGKTVEVLNTDAEGRLVLADGLSLLSELGFGPVIEQVEIAAQETGELVWHMPLAEELRELLSSELADMTNAKIGNRAGGMLVGGLFLKEYVAKDSSWAHIDIASAANNDGSPYSVYPAGATGVMIRTLVQLAKNLAGAK